MASEGPSEETYKERRKEVLAGFGKDVDFFPKESAMARLLNRLRSRFSVPSVPPARHDYDDRGDEAEKYYEKAVRKFEDKRDHYAENVDASIRNFVHQQYIFHSKVKGAKGPFPGFFRVAQDDEVEAATEQLVEKFRRYHPHMSAKGEGGYSAEWNETARTKSVRAFMHSIKKLRKAERARLAAFQETEVTDLNLNKAYAESPLYQLLQKSGIKGGPYGFAVEMSRLLHEDSGIFRAGKEIQAQQLVKKLASKYGLTKNEMSGILIESQHVRSGIGLRQQPYLHGLEQQIFTTKFTMNKFGEHVASTLKREKKRLHMKEVLQKIYLESKHASARAEVRSDPMPQTEEEPESAAMVANMDEREASPEAFASTSLDDRLNMAARRSESLLAKKKKGAVRGSEERELSHEQQKRAVIDSNDKMDRLMGVLPEPGDMLRDTEQDKDYYDNFRQAFPEVHSRIVKIGADELKGLARRANIVTGSTHYYGTEYPKGSQPITRYPSTGSRFMNPEYIKNKDAPKVGNRSWFFEGPDYQPPGSKRKVDVWLLDDPIYQHMQNRISEIGHAFNTADMESIRDHMGVDDSDTLFEKFQSNFNYNPTGTNPDKKASTSRFKAFVPLDKSAGKHMFQALTNRSKQLSLAGREVQAVTYDLAEAVEKAYQNHRNVLNPTEHLAYLRRTYSDLLKKVLDRDAFLLAQNTIEQGLGKQLMQAGKFNEDPFKREHGILQGDIDWGNSTLTRGKRKGEKDPTFSPHTTLEKTVSGGWTGDNFLRLMYQIPEMELYLDTDGYQDWTQYPVPHKMEPYAETPGYYIEGESRERNPSYYAESRERSPSEELGSRTRSTSRLAEDLPEAAVESGRRMGSRSRSRSQPQMTQEDEKREPTPTPIEVESDPQSGISTPRAQSAEVVDLTEDDPDDAETKEERVDRPSKPIEAGDVLKKPDKGGLELFGHKPETKDTAWADEVAKEINKGGLHNVYVQYAKKYYNWEDQDYQRKGGGRRDPISVESVVKFLKDDFSEDVAKIGQVESLKFPEKAITEEVTNARKHKLDQRQQFVSDAMEAAKGKGKDAKQRERQEKKLQKQAKKDAEGKAKLRHDLFEGKAKSTVSVAPRRPQSLLYASPAPAARPPPPKAKKLTRAQKLDALKAEREELAANLVTSPGDETIKARLLEIIKEQRILVAAKPTSPKRLKPAPTIAAPTIIQVPPPLIATPPVQPPPRQPSPPPPTPPVRGRGRGRGGRGARGRGARRQPSHTRSPVPPGTFGSQRRGSQSRSRSAHAARVLHPQRQVMGLQPPRQPFIIAPVIANELRSAVTVHHERTERPSALGAQALFRGYTHNVGPNVAPMGRVHLVSMAQHAGPRHFMRELTEDANMGRRKVEAESRHGPFRDQKGDYKTMARSASIRYQVRNRAIHITIRRAVESREMDVLIGKLGAHRMSVNGSRLTLIVDGRKIRLGKLEHTDLEKLRETIQRALARRSTVGLMIHDVKPNGALHRAHRPNYEYL